MTKPETMKAVREALIAAQDKDDCFTDHHGNCQQHTLKNPCEQKLIRTARSLLDTEASQQEKCRECGGSGQSTVELQDDLGSVFTAEPCQYCHGTGTAPSPSQQDREADLVSKVAYGHKQVVKLREENAALTAERDTLQRTIKGLTDRLTMLRKRLPVCPPCEIGEDSPCICEEPLVPKVYLDETADRALAAEDREAKLTAERDRLREALESLDRWQGNVGCNASVYTVSDEQWSDMQYIIHAALAAYKKVDG